MLAHFMDDETNMLYMVASMGKSECMLFKRQLIFRCFFLSIGVRFFVYCLFINPCFINILYLRIHVAYPPFDFTAAPSSPPAIHLLNISYKSQRIISSLKHVTACINEAMKPISHSLISLRTHTLFFWRLLL